MELPYKREIHAFHYPVSSFLWLSLSPFPPFLTVTHVPLFPYLSLTPSLCFVSFYSFMFCATQCLPFSSPFLCFYHTMLSISVLLFLLPSLCLPPPPHRPKKNFFQRGQGRGGESLYARSEVRKKKIFPLLLIICCCVCVCMAPWIPLLSAEGQIASTCTSSLAQGRQVWTWGCWGVTMSL